MRWTRLVSTGLGTMLLLALKPQDAAPAATDSLTAAQILERVAKVYASCKSYRDAGAVQTVITPTKPAADGQPAPDASAAIPLKSTPFRTAFVRPGRFHFEFSVVTLDIVGEHTTYRYIVWQNGSDVRTWWGMKPGVNHFDSIRSALLEAGLWSKGSAVTIPPMLMPSWNSAPVFVERLAQTERFPDAKLDDVPCFVVKGKHSDTDDTIWIDQRTLLIRRIRSVTDVNGTHIEDTTTFEPEVDVDIGEGELAFETPRVPLPPAAGQR